MDEEKEKLEGTINTMKDQLNSVED